MTGQKTRCSRSRLPLGAALALVSVSAQALLAAPGAAADSTSTVTLAPTADSYVTSDAPERNFGGTDRLRVDGGPVDLALLAFDLTAYAGRRLTGADLLLRVTTNASADRPTVRLVGDETWTETGVTYRSRPAVGSAVLGTLDPTTTGTDHTVSLDHVALAPELGSRLDLAVRAAGLDGLLLASRETATPPRLVLSFAEPTPPPVTLADLRDRALTAPNTMAHRLGGANIAGDNDLTALDRLASEGWDGVLVDGGDLRQGSGSDFIPVMHDATVDRTTTGTGEVRTFTAAA